MRSVPLLFVRFAALLALLSAAPWLHAQGDPGGGLVKLDVHVTVSPKVKGLVFVTVRNRHEATYTVSATVDQSVQAGYTRVFTWSGDGLEFDNVHAASTTARATGPGKFFPNCDVTDTKTGSPTIYNGSDAKVCWAIGGPVVVSVVSTATPTYLNDANDSSKSFFLTYYNYSHASTMPNKSQPTQDGRAQVWTQPAGTTVSWTIGSSLYSSTLTTNPHALIIDLKAEAASKDVAIRAHFDFYDPTNLASGSCDDDSDTTYVELEGAWVPLVYTVSGHKPGSLVEESTQDYEPTHSSGQDYCGTSYKYRLADTNGEIMPGVLDSGTVAQRKQLELVHEHRFSLLEDSS
jgi:hypothetical protein